ncbi:chemotaxis protein MotB [Inquilinus ginsengisoli]|uniref:Chemotaxis protein MotB n=1 Tax=Inquilinus ginsengisoli TaxID=363840 RepID=A0ABU1JXM6_9PROT|nr:peptidoglycan -binding protein [Inquilinus ginsengisoli]MDR6292739.1 chemotaxis protein MotB [Inquilinus ginsengisoli]
MRGRYSFGERRQVDVWPGWVDALSSLLMVVIFLLMVFLVSQFYLSTMVSGRDETVGRLNRQVSDLTDRLALEQETGHDLQTRIARLSTDLDGTARERADLGNRLAAAEQGRDAIDRQLRTALAQIQTLTGGTTDRDAQLQEAARVIQDNQATIERQRRELAQLQADAATLRTSGQDRDLTVTNLSTALAASRKDASDLGATLQQRQAEATALAAELDRTRTARDQATRDAQAGQDRVKTLETQLGDANSRIAASQKDVQGLTAQLGDATSRAAASQKDVQDLTARVEQLNARIADLSGTLDRATAALATEKSTSDSERKTSQQLATEAAALRQQLSQIESTLRDSESTVTAKDLEIANLNSRLNQALVRKVDELSRSRSAFFGKLRDVLGERQDVRVVGDRFVFQSEVLFPVGSAQLQEGGEQQLATFAETLKRIAAQFPPDVDWLLRIDGHTDRQPFSGNGPYATNWELSTARALSVLNFLASQGIPPQRMAAAGFGEWQPLDTGTTPDAYRRNRRIELRLDQRGDSSADAPATGQ